MLDQKPDHGVGNDEGKVTCRLRVLIVPVYIHTHRWCCSLSLPPSLPCVPADPLQRLQRPLHGAVPPPGHEVPELCVLQHGSGRAVPAVLGGAVTTGIRAWRGARRGAPRRPGDCFTN